MSYCRFGWDGSDVYVFADVRGGWTCCACRMNEPIGNRAFPPDTNVDTPGKMAAHLREHRARGHTVPEDAISELDAEETNERTP